MDNINKNEIVALQEYLLQQMKFSGLTMQVTSEYLEYGHKSSVSRSLAKQRMPAIDAIKILALLQVRTVSLKGIFIQLTIKSDDLKQRMKICEKLFDLFQDEVFLPGSSRKKLPNTTWNEIAAKSDYNDGESARRAWVELNTPLSLVLTVLELSEQTEVTVKTPQGDILTIGIKQKKVAGPLPDNQIFSN